MRHLRRLLLPPATEISTFTRNGDDTLTWLSCRSLDGSADGNPGVCQQEDRLQLVTKVLVSPDGQNVYASAGRSNPKQGAQDIVIYDRDANTGLITPLADPNGCWANSDTGPTPGCQTANGMADPVTMALSPAGDQMYVGVDNDVGDQGGPQPPAGIALFNRELPPTCAPASATVEAGETATLTPACSGANGNPVTIATVGAPTHGSVRPGPGGQLLFDPDANFVGTATFSFEASDGTLSSAPGHLGKVRVAVHSRGHVHATARYVARLTQTVTASGSVKLVSPAHPKKAT